MLSTITTASAPDDETQKALAGAFIAIMAANKAIELQGDLPVLTIEGLEDVNKSLATAKENAQYWSVTLAANVQNQLQAIIDYNSLYVPLADTINQAISAIKRSTKENPPSDDTMNNLAAELAALQNQVQVNLYGNGGTASNPQQASALGVYNQLNNYQTNVAKDSATFSAYNTLAFSSESGVSAEIQQLNSDIDADNAAMAKDRAMIGGGAAMIVTGALICVVAVALAPETGGATIAVIATVGVATIVGGAVMIGVASHDLDAKEADVSQKIIKIANDNAELVSLTTINTSTSNLVTHTSQVYGALDTIKTSWQQMDNEMGDVISALNKPEAELMEWIKNKTGTSNPTYAVMGAILEAQFAAPQADWKRAAATAQTILNAMANVVYFTLPTGTIPTQKTIAEHMAALQVA